MLPVRCLVYKKQKQLKRYAFFQGHLEHVTTIKESKNYKEIVDNKQKNLWRCILSIEGLENLAITGRQNHKRIMKTTISIFLGFTL